VGAAALAVVAARVAVGEAVLVEINLAAAAVDSAAADALVALHPVEAAAHLRICKS
jgi:hypothetical protein